MKLSAFYLKSPLAYNEDLDQENKAFIAEIEGKLGFELAFRDFDEMKADDFPLVFVGTGGSEGIYLNSPAKTNTCFLLTSGNNNSLAASMEILSYMNLNDGQGEIIHGSTDAIAKRITTLMTIHNAKKVLSTMKIGAFGAPSDWLIASDVDYKELKDRCGLEVVDVTIAELITEIEKNQYPENEYTKQLMATGYNKDELLKAFYVYGALKRLCDKYSLGALTVRCFDLLGGLKSTACVALAILNAEGIYSGCEGDMQSLISMVVLGVLSGKPVFMCNPSRLSPENNEIVLAHCTLPINMPTKYTLNTHFESGIGVALAGDIPLGAATLFKCSWDFESHMAAPVSIDETLNDRNLCRTQIRVSLPTEACEYFLNYPIGNHHLVCCGDYSELLHQFFAFI